MAALVAYPVASRHDRGLRRQRTPQSKTGWDDLRNGNVSHELAFRIACMYLQNAVLQMFPERCELSSDKNTYANASAISRPTYKQKELRLPSALPSVVAASEREDLENDPQRDYTSTDVFAQCSTDLPVEVPASSGTPRVRSTRTSDPFPSTTPEVDFFSLHNVRTYAKKKKKATPAAFSWDDNEKKEEGTAEGGEGGAGDGSGGASGGAGGAGGDEGGGGDDKGGDDDWDDWSGGKKKGKKGKKQNEDEEEEKPKEEKDDWAGVGGEDEWGGWGAAKGKKKTEKKTEDDPAASTNAWADAGGAGGEDDDWAGFAAGGKKKKNKKKQADDPAKPAEDSFHEINLGDEGDLGAPKISLSFDEPAPAKKEEPASSGFGFGGWGSSWSFGGLAGKKDEDKDKNGEKSPGSGGFWGKSSLSDFNFGFGANTDGKSLDIGESKKQAEDEDDFLPAWGGGASSTKKGTEKKSKFGIEEVDDPPPPPKASDDTWGGWGKKTTTTKKDTATTDSWSGSGWGTGTTAAKKDKKKTGASWADLMEEEDDTTALPSIKDDKKTEDSWGMWGSKSKDTKKADDDIWGGFESGSKKKDAKSAIEEVVEEDLSVLKGLTCEKDGRILDNNGDQIGELYEGDASTISRRLYLCSEKGEFKDKKFKVIGKARVVPREPPADAPPAEDATGADDAGAPPLSALEGLCCERDGTIKDYSGKVIGQVVEGDAAEFCSKMYFCDGNGNVCDYKNKSVGKCKTIGSAKPKEPKKDDDIWGWAAKSKVPPPPKASAKKDDKKADDMWGSWGSKNDKAAEEEKPAEDAAAGGDLPPLSILLDRTVDADGKVYDDDNIPIGECVDGDIPTIARRKYKIDAEGNVMSRLGKVLGKCVVLPGEKKEEAPPEPEPVIEEAKEEPAAEPPPLSVLKGRTVEADGTILNADGDVIGEVTEGDPERFASISAKCDGNGNIVNSKKKAVGKCKTVAPQSNPVTEAPLEAPVDEAPVVEESSKPKFTLADLMGRKIENNGDILDDDFNPIAKVIDGNAKQMSKKGAICDAEGNIVLGKKTLGKVELLEPAVVEEISAEPEPIVEEELPPPVDESPPSASGLTLASLEGLPVEADGSVFDSNGNLVAQVVEGKAKQMSKKKATCDASGNVIFGFSTLGRVELVVPEGGAEEPAEPEAEAPPPPPPIEEEPPQAEAPTLASLEGRSIEKNGDILDDAGEVIGRLVAGSASKLAKGGAKCDADGNVLMKSKIQKDAKVELVVPVKVEEEPVPMEEEAAPPEPPAEEANPFAKLDGLRVEKNGDILDANGDLVALLVGGSASKLFKAGATLDAEGKIWAKGKEIKDAKIELIEAEKAEEIPPVAEPPAVEDPPPSPPEESPFAKLDGRKMEKNGDILDDDGNVLATVIGGSLSKLYKAAATCDAEGKIWAKGKEVKDATVELVQPPEPEALPPPSEEAPPEEPATKAPEQPSFASIDGKLLDKFGEIYNDDNVLVARLVEGSAGSLYKKGAYCDADGNVVVNGKKQKTAKLELVVLEDIPEPEPEVAPVEEEAPAASSGRTLAYLEGFAIDLSGDIFDDDGIIVGKLVEGSATKLYAKYATCGSDGSVMANGKVIKGARVELVGADQPVEPEPAPEELPPPPPPAPAELTLADLEGFGFDDDGNVLNNDGVIVGKLIGETKKLKAILSAKATCGSDGSVFAKGKKVPKVSVEVIQPEVPAVEEAIPEPPPEPEAEPEPPAEPEAEAPTLAILEGRPIDKSGDIFDDDMNVIGRLVEGDPKKLAKQAATCDADGGVRAKKKLVVGARVELVLPDPPTPPEPEEGAEHEPEPPTEALPEAPTLASLDGRTISASGDILDDNDVVIGRLVDGLDKLKLLVKNKAVCDADGNVWAKGKQVPRARVEVVIPDPPPPPAGNDAVQDLLDSIDNPDDAWGDPWAAGKSDDKALTRVTTKSSKASKEDDSWGNWLGGGKNDKKKNDDPMVMQAEAVDEFDADKKDEDSFGFAFTNKKKSTKKKGLVEAIDDFDTPTQKAETIEEQKSSGQEDSDWAFASNRVKAKKAAAKTGTKSSLKAIEAMPAPTPPEDVVDDADPAPEDDGIVPDDSASVYKEPIKKKDDKSKASSMWGGLFGAKTSSSSKTPALSQLRKEREEREKKDRAEKEEQERIERERIEAEQAERERIEQEERDKALKEAEKAQKSSKKSSKKLTKSKAEEPLPPPPPPPPAAPLDDFEPEADESNDPFAKWGLKRKPIKSTNEKSSLAADAKKSLETAGDDMLPIANGKSAVASSSSKMGIKSSSKLKSGSVADRIKALQGETKLKDDPTLDIPVPPPPPAAPPEETNDWVPETSTKKSKKLGTSSKSAKSSKKEPEPVPLPDPPKKKVFEIGGFPDSDDEPLIDLAESKPPTPPPEPDMGAQGISKSSKKLGSKSASRSAKTPTKSSKSKPKKVESGSETEAEPEGQAVTQGSGSTTAVDDQQVIDGKLPTPPPELEKRKSTSPTARKERPKVVRGTTGSAWGFWGTSAPPKEARSKPKDISGTPMAVRTRAPRKSVPTDPEKSENEKKSSKPTPKRASTFSIFSPAPAATRRQSTRSSRRPSSRPQSGRASPVENDDDNDEVPRVSSKAAKLMGMNPSAGASASRRAPTKSKGKTSEIAPYRASLHTSPQEREVDTQQQTGRSKDPYALPSDDEDGDELPDNGNDIYAVDAPAAPPKDRRSKRRSAAEASASAREDEPLADEDPSQDGARALGADTRDPPASRRHSPSTRTRRSISRSVPQKAAEVGGIMGLFGALRRSSTTKDTPRSSDPSFAGGKSRGAGYETDAGYGRSSKRSNEDDDSAARRERRARRKSRREPDEGFTTDAAGAQTDYEQAERRRAERREARRAEKERSAEVARESEERDARRRDRDGDKEARRAARRERDEARIAEEVEKRRRAEKEERRAARKAKDEERVRQEEQSRADDEARAAKEERRARRRAEREARETDAERPRGERRKSSYMDGGDDAKHRSSRRDSRRMSKATPVDDYFDSRNGQTGGTPYFGGPGGDKTSSWVDSVNREPPAPLQPEDTATVIEPMPEEEEEVDHGAESEEEIRRRMHGRRERRRDRDSGEVREPRDERDREERRRDRKRRDRAHGGEKTSDPDVDKDRRRRSSYYPEPNHPYPDYDMVERPQAPKRQSWLKKIPINNLF